MAPSLYPSRPEPDDERLDQDPGSSNATQSAPNWSDLVARIQQNDPDAMAELYRLFSRGIRFYLCRQLGPQDLDDKVHDTFVIVIQAIRRGDLREADRLMGFVRTVVRRQVATYIDRAVQTRRGRVDLDQSINVRDARLGPEEAAMNRQMERIAERVLRGISERDREILTRFYLLEQSAEEICAEMNLTETQFRLLKSRAKARFGALGRKKLFRARFR